MTPDEQLAYIQQTYRRSPEGSARRLWAAAQLKALAQKTGAAQPAPTPTPRNRK